MPVNSQPLSPISLARVAPELRPAVERLPRLPIDNPLVAWFMRGASKLMLLTPAFEGVRLEKSSTSAGSGLRVYTPTVSLPHAGLLWIHGGGMVIGSAAQDDAFCATTARELGIVVVSAEYRLAPKHPFPAALDDCLAAWNWFQNAAPRWQFDPQRIAVGGQSAGGGLAASLVQRLHDSGGVQPIAQWLFCPMLDDRTAARRELDAVAHKVWDNRHNRYGWRSFLNVEPGAEVVPAYAVPARRSDLRGLPPAWIGTGDIELFFEENRAYAERLSAAGVACTLDVVEGAYHGFESIARSARLTQDYLARARAWLAGRIAA